jgi:hypothetical protein
MDHLQPLMQDASNVVQKDAYRVYGALLDAVSAAVYERLMEFSVPGLSECSPPAGK